MTWICCQIGAREHYAVPRALHRHGALKALLADAWLPPGNPLRQITSKGRDRFHHDLAGASVFASTFGSAAFDLRGALAGLRGWRRIMARNEWFEEIAVSRLSTIRESRAPCTLFAYSYAAKKL